MVALPPFPPARAWVPSDLGGQPIWGLGCPWPDKAWQKTIGSIALGTLMALASGGLGAERVWGANPTSDRSLPTQIPAGNPVATPLSLLEEGNQWYQGGNFARAAQVWQQAADQLQEHPLAQAMALTHLSLAQRQMGQWELAQSSLDHSGVLLHQLPPSPEQQFALAKMFNALGSLDLTQGKLLTALTSFQQATALYGELGDMHGQYQSQINQAKVLQAQGRNPLAQRELQAIVDRLLGSPNSPLKAATLRQLGEVVQLTSSLAAGQELLEQSLAVAQSLPSSPEATREISATLLSLGILTQNQLETPKALDYYQRVVEISPSPEVQLQAQINAFTLATRRQAPTTASDRGESGSFDPGQLRQSIEATWGQIPPSRTVLFAQIQYVHSLLAYQQQNQQLAPDYPHLARLLAQVIGQAQGLGDLQAESYGVGRLGLIYEQGDRLPEAQALTQKALALAEQANTPEIIYQWQWQLGRILWAKGQLDAAEQAYQQAIATVEELRSDLASLNPDARFSFRDEIEPVYREYVSLLLTPRSPKSAARLPAHPLPAHPLPTQEIPPLGLLPRSLESPAIDPHFPAAPLALGNAPGDDRSPAPALPSKPFPLPSLDQLPRPTFTPTSPFAPLTKALAPKFAPQFASQFLPLGFSPLGSDAPQQPRAQGGISDAPISQENLTKARDVIESLQLAELVNFFQADCVSVNAINADQVDPKAGVIYTIMLNDRLEILMSQRDQPIYHQRVTIDRTRLQYVINLFQQRLRNPTGGFLQPSQKLYDWVIRPLESELAQRDIETLVFVLDGELRNIPMAALQDGRQYLIEKYAIGLTPGLKLFDPKPLSNQPLAAFIGGLSEARQGFTPLPSVVDEVKTISQFVPSTLLLDSTFQENLVSKEIAQTHSPIVHFATHGQFSSNANDTFILTWDDKINIHELSQLLQGGFQGENQAIELLVFSACETAAGDSRAALGLAGLAVRAGARSTLATLWQVDDLGTATFMGNFYQNLGQRQLPKAEALRQAQLSLLQTQEFAHPFYWSPFVLVGNWL